MTETRDDFPDITKESPSRTQMLLALGVVPGLLVVVFCIARPFAGVQLRAIEAFVPVYVTAMFLNGLTTAVILFAQFSILRTRALLVIANGYLFLGLMAIPYTLSFPGVFEPGRSLIGGLQSTPWLYILRHCGFAMFLSAFALLKDSGTPLRHWQRNVTHTIILSVAMTTAVVLAAALVCITGEARLPIIISDRFHFDATWVYYAGVPIASLYILALILLWFQRHTVLGLWLMVVTCVHLVGVPLSFYPPPIRFSVGWYTVVILNLLANSLVLMVLLAEVSKLYALILLAVRAQHREREARFATGDAIAAMIAHEVKQPLSAMVTRAETSIRWLGHSNPDLRKTTATLQHLVADGHRAAAIIERVRASFRKESQIRSPIDLNSLVDETIELLRSDLERHRIEVRAEPDAKLPQVAGDRIQLQQVLVNLITNAIDSMAREAPPRLLSVRSELRRDGSVMVSVSDTGPGVKAQDADLIFDPLFTTKPSGMGMGLSICRSIIQAHSGSLLLVTDNPKGATFQIVLQPAADIGNLITGE